MPTGYTAGILDGTTKNFKEFAIKCSRAFLMHMRDEPMSSKYKKQTVSTYHSNEIKEAESELAKLKVITDEELLKQERIRLIDSKKYHLESIQKDDADEVKLTEFLQEARAYKAPTSTHEGISEFMISQLKDTIEHDCSSSYHKDELKRIDEKIDNLDAVSIRSSLEESIKYDLTYHVEAYNMEVSKVDASNKWYDDFINSLG